MKVEEVCRKYGLPEGVAEKLGGAGVNELYPPQAEALEKGALEGKNLVMAVPTASGKTLIAELVMLKSVLKEGGKCIYIVPLRALASEKFEEFKEKYEGLGVRVGISTGDFDYVDPRLSKYDILIATSEKVDSLLRHRAKWLADVASVVVLDEIHLIDEPGRGPTLEVLTARLKQVNQKLQTIALSATIKNADEIAEWLSAELVKSDWRPVPLKKGVYYRRKIEFDDESKKAVNVDAEEDVAALAVQTVGEGGQALVFVNNRRSAQATATMLTKYINDFISGEDREKLVAVAKIIEGALGEPTRTCRQLADSVRKGTAFHHAGLHHAQRKAVEDAFRKNLVKVICATPTLAAGVNLPSRRTIIRDYRRYVEPFGMQFIPVLEFHQMAGRAGRPQYDDYGEAVLIARGKGEAEALFDEFILAQPERITSKLATEPALRTHVLASIAAGYVTDEGGLMEFMEKTFFAYQYGTREVSRVVDLVLDFLEREEMIRRQNKLLIATPFGERVSRLYIDPLSAVVLRDGLTGVTSEPTDIGLLHLICKTPDMGTLYLREHEYEEMEQFFKKHMKELIAQIPDYHREPEKFEMLLAELKTAQLLKMWVDETREDDLHERFGIGAGDIRRKAETAKWLLYGAHELASLFKTGKALAPLRRLQDRTRYGVKEELLELVQFRGIGRVRARSLFRAGFRKLSDIEKSTEESLAKVPYIGTEIARSIRKQAHEIEEAPVPENESA